MLSLNGDLTLWSDKNMGYMRERNDRDQDNKEILRDVILLLNAAFTSLHSVDQGSTACGRLPKIKVHLFHIFLLSLC